ncbi:DNA polymerase III subunit gamma/tau [Altererythrobacter aerius]|uniref:DNA polymerase III subunit gamma/tau n=1 Tax=Tsuneonella aeria TaxID=1837929 RepID=A0A6I4TE31_9SPHN|nr:DNA polymerase III subunit gamma/tau [Tsuneonella aeria]MXO74435.1 DNA polymerase III subunit gamma/tau [Tsuneonella aeria]
MSDSGDMFGDTPPEKPAEGDAADARPTAAELEAAGQNSMFGDLAPAPGPAPAPADPAAPALAPSSPEPAEAARPSRPEASQPYRVLARKYRPQTFSELIGQEPMVRTLANAIKRDRLAHAFLMTGVRGVGKTSTARLIAKALNCIGPDGQGGPTIDPCGTCEPCRAIAEGRHIDVIEMDAASHTGINDIREIIEAVRYAAVSARYKIYIIDEVHMLSTPAFNGLLKTLEEPPAHVKFLFATTEVDKLPVTVLSRTQRFDLRRISPEMLQQHFASVCRQEGVGAEDEALHLIAAAAEGSVRDGLSILDQAIAHADLDLDGPEQAPQVTASRVRDMLGLADKGAQRRLFACLLEGDAKGLLAALDDQYALGVEPLALMRTLLELTNRITVAQVGGSGADAPTAEERAVIDGWTGQLSPGQLHRLWQLLLKGYDEVRSAPDPLVAAQMALLRTLHAADLPDPGTLAKTLEDMAARAAANPAPSVAGADAPAPAARAIEWADLVRDLEQQSGQLHLASRLRMQVRPVSVAHGTLTYEQAPGFGDDLASDIRQGLFELTGERWQVERVETGGAPSLYEIEQAEQAAAEERLRAHPLVEATLAAFPDAVMLSEEDDAGAPPWSRRA